MKKLSIVLLALVVGVFFASTALAFHEGNEGTADGALGVTGSYYFDAESVSDNAGGESAGYDDDLELVLRVNMGTVTATIDFEISDDGTWDGSNISRGTNLDASTDYVVADSASTPVTVTDTNTVTKLIDNYWIEWVTPVDGLKVKIGEYGLSFGRKVLIYADPPAHEIGFLYNMDAADLGLYVGKVSEGERDDDDDDFDSIILTANVKSVDFFSKLNFIFVTADDGGNDLTHSYVGFDTAFTAGPVAVALEYGSIASDIDTVDGGNFMVVQLGFDELAGFDINLDYFSSSEEFSDSAFDMGGGDYYPYKIVGWTDAASDDVIPRSADGLSDMTLIGISGSYAINDKATFNGKVLASGEVDGDALGTEIDASVTYKFDDNTTGYFSVATLSPDDEFYGGNDDSVTDMRARFVFKF